MVAPADPDGAVRRGKQRGYFRLGEEADVAGAGSFLRDGQDTSDEAGVFGVVCDASLLLRT